MVVVAVVVCQLNTVGRLAPGEAPTLVAEKLPPHVGHAVVLEPTCHVPQNFPDPTEALVARHCMRRCCVHLEQCTPKLNERGLWPTDHSTQRTVIDEK